MYTQVKIYWNPKKEKLKNKNFPLLSIKHSYRGECSSLIRSVSGQSVLYIERQILGQCKVAYICENASDLILNLDSNWVSHLAAIGPTEGLGNYMLIETSLIHLFFRGET